MSEKPYEQKQAEMEAILAKLESGNVPMDELMALYKQGEALYQQCAAQLDAYEQQLQQEEPKERP